MYYVTSDLHLNHANIIKYEPVSRPFSSVEEMNETIIRNWNNKVKDEDTVFILGDLCMGKNDEAAALVNQLKGKKILIRGNHDSSARRKIFKEECGIELHDIYYLPYKGRYFVMCHFPIASEEFLEMVRKDNSEVIVLYGHIHSNAPTGYIDGTFHVGVDTNNLTPVSIEEIWQQSWPNANEEVLAYKNKYEKETVNHECDV